MKPTTLTIFVALLSVLILSCGSENSAGGSPDENKLAALSHCEQEFASDGADDILSYSSYDNSVRCLNNFCTGTEQGCDGLNWRRVAPRLIACYTGQMINECDTKMVRRILEIGLWNW